MTSSIRVKQLFDGESFIGPSEIEYSNGIVTAVRSYEGDRFDGDLLVPGFVDVQVNGGGGYLFNSLPSVDGLRTMAEAHAQFGTTAMLPTLITDTADNLECAADVIAQALSISVPGIVGVHFEGPHLAHAKKGTHAEQYIRPITEREMAVYTRSDLGKVMVTLAPECVSVDQITRLTQAGVIVALGHTSCSYSQAKHALDAGASGFTHLFNAMSSWTGRDLGAVGASLMHTQRYAGIIADGFHLAPETIQLVDRIRDPDYNVLVTDSMSLVGTDLQSLEFFDRIITNDNGKLTSTTGELAGSNLNMHLAVHYCIEKIGIDAVRALRMASRNPARWLGDEQRGKIAIGGHADFVLLSNSFNIISVIIAGHNKSLSGH